jgi:tetratricopeptide (TPR) repeat protein
VAARRLGVIEARLGHTDEAVGAFRQAREEFAALAAEFPAESGHRRALAVTENDLGSQLRLIGRLEEAEAAYRASIDLFRALAAEQPDEPRHRTNMAGTRTNLGRVFDQRGRPALAVEEFRQALAVLEEVAAAHPGDPGIRRQLATVQDNLGHLYKDRFKDRLAEAEAAYRAGLALRAKLAAEFPDDAAYRRELSGSHNNLGLLLDDTRRPEEAEAEQLAAVHIREELVSHFQGVPEYRVLLAGSCGNVGRLYRKHGRAADSLAWFTRGIETLAAEREREPRNEETRVFLRNTHAGRALALADLRRHAEALKDWDAAIALSPEPEARGRERASRATSLVQAGRVAEAVAEVADLTRSAGWSAEQLYDFACVYSLASGKDPANREAFAARAVGLLRQAVAAGWKDAAHLRTDADLDPLRMREDFQKLLASLRR